MEQLVNTENLNIFFITTSLAQQEFFLFLSPRGKKKSSFKNVRTTKISPNSFGYNAVVSKLEFCRSLLMNLIFSWCSILVALCQVNNIPSSHPLRLLKRDFSRNTLNKVCVLELKIVVSVQFLVYILVIQALNVMDYISQDAQNFTDITKTERT